MNTSLFNLKHDEYKLIMCQFSWDIPIQLLISHFLSKKNLLVYYVYMWKNDKDKKIVILTMDKIVLKWNSRWQSNNEVNSSSGSKHEPRLIKVDSKFGSNPFFI